MAVRFNTCSPFLCFITLVWLSTFAIGIGSLAGGTVLVVNGQPDLEMALILDHPDDAFEYLGETCNVSRIDHCWSTIHGDDNSTQCRFHYYARFTAPTFSGDRLWNSYPEYIANGTWDCGSGCYAEDAVRVPSGRLETGGQYGCWKPVGETYEPRWQCGNDNCIKISDPSLLSEHYWARAYHYYSWGLGLMVLALCSCCCCSILTTRVEARLFVTAGPTVSVIAKAPMPAAVRVTTTKNGPVDRV